MGYIYLAAAAGFAAAAIVITLWFRREDNAWKAVGCIGGTLLCLGASLGLSPLRNLLSVEASWSPVVFLVGCTVNLVAWFGQSAIKWPRRVQRDGPGR